MELFLSALALVMIIEGLPYFLNPEGMQRMAEFMSSLEPSILRAVGFFLMSMGLLMLYVFYPA